MIPSVTNTSAELATLNIHRFPTKEAFDIAASDNLIGIRDISFIEGDTSDVPIPTIQEAGYVLTAGASHEMYWNQNSAGSSTLAGLNDTNIANPASGQALIFNGSSWANTTISKNHDFTHTQILGTPNSVTFAADERCSVFAYASTDTSMSIECENNSDNYIWICNSGSSDIDITISDITQNSTSVSNVYMPEDGITIPTGKVCEIGVIVNSSGAFITCRNDIVLSSSI